MPRISSRLLAGCSCWAIEAVMDEASVPPHTALARKNTSAGYEGEKEGERGRGRDWKREKEKERGEEGKMKERKKKKKVNVCFYRCVAKFMIIIYG